MFGSCWDHRLGSETAAPEALNALAGGGAPELPDDRTLEEEELRKAAEGGGAPLDPLRRICEVAGVAVLAGAALLLTGGGPINSSHGSSGGEGIFRYVNYYISFPESDYCEYRSLQYNAFCTSIVGEMATTNVRRAPREVRALCEVL